MKLNVLGNLGKLLETEKSNIFIKNFLVKLRKHVHECNFFVLGILRDGKTLRLFLKNTREASEGYLNIL